jgi:hypothetical protein
MPYRLSQSSGGYFVVNDAGVRKNKQPMSRSRALRFLKALYANVPDATTKAANYSAGAGETISGALGRGGDGKFTRVGSPDASKARKLVQDIARKQQQQQAKKKPAKGKSKRAAAAKKPTPKKGAAPKKSDAQKEQERQAKLAQRQAEREQRRKEAEAKKQQARRENDKKVAEGAGLGTDTHDALTEFASPDEKIQLSPSMAADLEKRGLVEKDSTGEYRMTAQGRQYVRAAESGDVRAAADAISEGSDTVVKNAQRATEKQARTDAQAKRRADVEARRAERKAKQKEKQSKGGGGGKAKPSEADKQAQREQQRASTRQSFAPQAGVDSADAEELARSATQPGTPNDRLVSAGLQNEQGEATDQGRRFLSAVERGDLRGAQAALQDARQRQERETRPPRISQRRQMRSVRRVKAQTASDRAMFAKMGGSGSGGGGGRGKGGGGALWSRGPDGKRVPSKKDVQRFRENMQSAAKKEAELSSKIRKVDNERAALDPSWGQRFNAKERKRRAAEQERLSKEYDDLRAQRKSVQKEGQRWYKLMQRAETRREQAASATKASLDETATLSVFKAQNGQWRWIIRSGSAFLDRDREIFSRKALMDAVERNRERGYYGPLRWWHCGEIDTVARKAGPGLDIGDCDFSGVIGRTLVESGTFREERYARAAQEHAAKLKASLGVVYKPLDISADRVYDRLDIVERSLCPADKARNQLSGSLHVFQR